MDVTYHIKTLDELVKHFKDRAAALRTEVPKLRRDRLITDGMATAYEQAADMIHRTRMDNQ
jgi:hypothetical protein